MSRTPKSLSSLIALSICFLVSSACSVPPVKVAPDMSTAVAPDVDRSKVVARVNSREITLGDLEQAKKIILANKPGLRIPPLLQKEFDQQALNQLIGTELLFQDSRKLQIPDLDTQTDEKLAEIRARFASPEDYTRELQKIDVDEQGLRASTRRDLAIAYLVNTRIAPGITVGDEEIRAFYDKNPDKFRTEEMVRASHILIGVPSTTSPEEKKKDREKAESLLKEVKAGTDFAQLAREKSNCPSNKQGGDLGYFGKGKMVPAFEQAAFALQAGGLSDIVETPFGFHIIQVTDHTKAEVLPFSAARERIENHLKYQKTNAAIETYVADLRKNAKIEVSL